MQIGQAAALVGLVEPANRDLAIVRFIDGRAHHAPLRDVAHDEIDGTVYASNGLFTLGSIRPGGGRREENLREVLRLPFDCDLADWLDKPKEELFACEQDELDRLLDEQQQEVEEVFADLHIPIHQLDRTGYGHVAYVRIAPADQGEVEALRRAHRWLVQKVNAHAGFRLADPQVSDAGTRITRLVPCLNTKGAIPRPSFTVYQKPGDVGVEDFAIEEPARPPARIIPDHARALSDASVRAIVDAITPHWHEGQRHWLALGLSGWFAKSGVPEEQAVAIIEAISAGDGEAWDRRRAVATTYERARSGRDVRGYHAMRDSLPEGAVIVIDQHLQGLRRSGRIIRAGDPDAPVEKPWPAPPASAFYGWFGEYKEIVEPTTEAPDAFHLGASLALAGAIIGRRVALNYISEFVYGNVYVALVGASGSSRKDTAIKRATTANYCEGSRRLAQPPYHIATDVSSSEGLVGMLKETPNTLLYLTELSALYRNGRRQSTSTIFSRLMEAWDTPSHLSNLSKGSPLIAPEPYLSIVAATQPKILAAEVSASEIYSGFANRWMYFVGVGKDPRPLPPDLDRARLYDRWLALFDAAHSYPTGSLLRLSPECVDRWVAWYQEAERARNAAPEEEAAMRARLATHAQKVALLYAVSDGAVCVEDRHLAAALDLVGWMWGNVERLLGEWGIGVGSQIERRVLDVLSRKGSMDRRKLAQQCSNARRWDATDFKRVLDAMFANETIVVDPETGKIGIPLEM